MPARRDIAFTLVEILISVALITVILVMLASITSSTQRTWTYTTANVEQFRDSREAFEAMTRKLSQATLSTYWDYEYKNGATQPPTNYTRQSYLRFISGNAASLTGTSDVVTHAVFFQAPLGYVSNSSYSNLDHLLNTWGYFIEFNDDRLLRPAFISPTLIPYRSRFRLMEMMEPSDSLSVYQYTSGIGKYQSNAPNNPLYMSGTGAPAGYTGLEWFRAPFNNDYSALNWPNFSTRPVRPIGENIVALVLLPMLSQYDQAATPSHGAYSPSSLAPNYAYDSTSTSQSDPNLDPKNQLPPVIQVTMVAVDEASYKRFQGTSATMPAALLVTSSTVFQTAGPDNTGYTQDMQSLQDNLRANHLNYRVFSSNVSIEGAKWSRAQQN